MIKKYRKTGLSLGFKNKKEYEDYKEKVVLSPPVESEVVIGKRRHKNKTHK